MSFPTCLHSRSSRIVHHFLTSNVLGQSTESYYSAMFTTRLLGNHPHTVEIRGRAQYAITIDLTASRRSHPARTAHLFFSARAHPQPYFHPCIFTDCTPSSCADSAEALYKLESSIRIAHNASGLLSVDLSSSFFLKYMKPSLPSIVKFASIRWCSHTVLYRPDSVCPSALGGTRRLPGEKALLHFSLPVPLHYPLYRYSADANINRIVTRVHARKPDASVTFTVQSSERD
jgi:hypothetical protein